MGRKGAQCTVVVVIMVDQRMVAALPRTRPASDPLSDQAHSNCLNTARSLAHFIPPVHVHLHACARHT